MNVAVVLTLGAIGALLLTANRASAQTNALQVIPGAGPNTKRVTLDNLTYVIFRTGDGHRYQVFLENDPRVFVFFDQSGIISEGGDAAALTKLKSDIHRFPKNLFVPA